MKSSNNSQPTKREKNKIIKRLENLGYNQRTFSKNVLNRKPQQFTQMLNGEQPGLLKATYEELEKLEQAQHE
jgi:hypothetical protein